MKFQTINPATEEVLHTYCNLNSADIKGKIEAGHEAYLVWKKTAVSERTKLLLNLIELLKLQKTELAQLITMEMGKPITAAHAEIEKCIWLCHHYAEHSDEYLKPQLIEMEQMRAKVCYRPLGILFGIMPWNFPFWQVFRFAVPTLMAGNGALLKHAAITTGCGKKIEALFYHAQFPEHLFQQLIIDNEDASQIIEHPYVCAVTLTGSERAGSSVAACAGKALKKSVLELGGCDPYLVLEDADLDLAAESIVRSRLNNSGQVCIAAKRVIAIKSIEEKLIEKIRHRMFLFTMGDPLSPQTQLGPLARADLRETLHEQVEKSVKQGAKLLCGGIIPNGKGYYYPATLLTDVKQGMPAFNEELFGPVIAVIAVADDNAAIACANEGDFGLGAAVFTRNLEKGDRIATEEIEAGACFVNALVASDPRVPFGGIKRSGYGRELSREGMLEFVNIKTVVINESNDA